MNYVFEKDFSSMKMKNINKQEPIVSVFLIANNKPVEKVKESLLTISNQSFDPLEIIVVSSNKELKKIIDEDKRIKLVNKDIKLVEDLISVSDSKSMFYTIIEAGEYIEKTYIETSIITLQLKDNEKVTYTDSVNYKNNKVFNYIFENKILKDNSVPVPNLVFEKEVFKALKNVKVKELRTWKKFIDIIKLYNAIHQSYYGFITDKTSSDLTEENYVYFERDIYSLDIVNYPMDDYYYEIVKSRLDRLVINKNINNKKNILLFIPWMVVGGADKFNLDFVRLIDKNKYNVTIISDLPTDYIWRQKFEEYATIFDISTFIDRRNWPTFLEYIIESRKIDLLLVSNSITGYNLIPYIKLKYPKLPIMDYIHSVELYNRYGGYGRDSNMLNSLIDKTLFCCKDAEKSYSKIFKDNKKKEVVYIGLDSDKFKPVKNREEVLKKFNIENSINIGYICRIHEQKRPLLLVEIAKKEIEINKNVKFIIGGTGPLLKSLKKKVKEYNLKDNFLFLGNVEDTIEFYSMCDLTINCSIKEGLALTVYESLSMGVPIVSADVGGHKEIIDSTCGVIVPLLQKEEDIKNYDYQDEEINNYVDAIEKIIKNLDKYKGNSRIRITEQFSLNNMIRNMERNIEEVITNKNEDVINNAKELKDNENLIYEYTNHYFMGSEYEFETQINKYYSKFEIEEEIKREDKTIIKIIKKLHLYSEYLLVKELFINVIKIILFPIRLVLLELRKIIRLLGGKDEEK